MQKRTLLMLRIDLGFIRKNQVKMIFVDETLIHIDDGKDYWLWIAYDEHDMDLC
jgi:transposase-like protein